MGQKKGGLTQSQRLGIVWLSAALALIAVVVFFSSRREPESIPADTSGVTGQQVLASKEDSVYRSRRQKSHNHQYTSRKTYEKVTLSEEMYSVAAPVPTKQPLVVELNSADTLTLQLLHGIGPAYARRIVRYRDRLGGFVSTDQLLEVYGFTPALLEHISPNLKLDKSAIRRVNINSIELKQLARHPYVEYYQARDIVQLRNNGVRFHSVDDLRAVPSMADTTLERLLPYLDFSDSTAAGD